jgi:hypothetical protein
VGIFHLEASSAIFAMDKLLDRLFGRGRTGWLKTALLSGWLGILGTMLRSGEDAAGERHSKYYWILLGYPALAILRSIYWNTRASRIRQMLGDQKRPKGEIQEHLRWTPGYAVPCRRRERSLPRRARGF